MAKKYTCHCAVIGGGAAGMMAAITAARAGKKVILMEHKERVGNKILQTGNGKCNFTNYNMDIHNFQNEDLGFVEQVLKKFNQKDTLKFFKEIGIYHKERQGYVYPHSETAASLQDALRQELEYCRVTVLTSCSIKKSEKEKDIFCTRAVLGEEEIFVYSSKVILATGSKAAPKSGSDGSGYTLAKAFGHKIKKPLPALVQLTSSNKCCKGMAGVRSMGKVTVYADGKELANDTGEIQYTEYGISGIPVFQVSRHALKAYEEKKEVQALVDFLPDMTMDMLSDDTKRRLEREGYKDVVSFFSGLLNKKLVQALVKFSGLDGNQPMAEMSVKKITKLLQLMKGFWFDITGSRGFEYAQVCQGGVVLSQVSAATMESKLCAGLYFAGEILDVDGKCGGYNLQWAWSSGYTAGKSAAY